MRSIAGLIGAILFVGLGAWEMCFQVSNEIGPIGADKAGRQIFLQTLDHYVKTSIDSLSEGYALDIDSEFESVPLWRRIVQEPLRTTFVMRYRNKDPQSEPDPTLIRGFFEAPADVIIDEYRGPISLREDWDVPPDSVRARLHELGGNTMGDFLSGLGFRVVEIYFDDELLVRDSLPTLGVGNTQRVGGD